MRFLYTLRNDIRFQIKYGFYVLYAFFTILYILALLLTPSSYKNIVASLIILTDPAMLGIFFMGGLWLLEKGEGLHQYWMISPLRPLEYIMAKSISLALLSTISAILIVVIGIGNIVHFPLLVCSVFFGSIVFNFIGLYVASFARSVNHYMLIVSLPTMVLSIPPILTAFGITHPFLEVFPGTALWHMILCSIDRTSSMHVFTGIILLLWLILSCIIVYKRIAIALQLEGGEKV